MTAVRSDGSGFGAEDFIGGLLRGLWALVRSPTTWYTLGTALLLLAAADALWHEDLAALAGGLEVPLVGGHLPGWLEAFHAWSGACALWGTAYLALALLGRILLPLLQERARSGQAMVLLEVQFHRDSEVKPGATADFYADVHGQLLPPGLGAAGLEEAAWLVGREPRLAWVLAGMAGRAHSYLYAPRAMREQVTAEVRGLFPGLDLTVAEDPLARAVAGAGGVTVGWQERVLAADSMYPLKVLEDFAVEDPLGPLSVAVVPRSGVAVAELAVVVRPVVDSWTRPGRQLLQALKETPAAAREREVELALERKMDSRGFDVVVRVTVAGEDPAAVREQLGDIGAHLERFSASSGGVRQSLVAAGGGTLRLPGGAEVGGPSRRGLLLGLRLGSPWPWPASDEVQGLDEARRRALLARVRGRARRALRRLLRRLPRPYFPPLYFALGTRKSVLNPRELATLAHNPHRGLRGNQALAWQPARALTIPPDMAVPLEGVPAAEAAALLGGGAPPRDRPLRSPSTWRGLPADTVIVGAGKDERGERHALGVPADELRLSWHVLGEQGTGKTSFIERFLYELRRLGRGWGVVEAKGDFARSLPRWLPEEDEDKLVWIDPRERHFPVGLNPLVALGGSRGVDADVVVSQIMGMFGRLFPTWDSSIGVQEILRNALHALLRGERYPTLMHLHVFLNAEGYRRAVLASPEVDVLVRSYWLEQVPNSTDITRTSFDAVRRRLSRFITAERTRYMFSQLLPTVDLARVLREGGLVMATLVPERAGEDIAGFIGAALITMWVQAAFTRVDLPEAERALYLLAMDEWQSYQTAEIGNALAKFRSLGVGLMLANQAMSQVDAKLRDLVEDLTLNKLVFGVRDPTVAGHVARVLGGGLGAEDVQFLPRFHAYLQRGRRPALLAATLPPPVEVQEVREMPAYGPQETGFRWPPPGDDRGELDRLVGEVWQCDPDDGERLEALVATLAALPERAWWALRRRRLERGLRERRFLLAQRDALPNRGTRLVYLSSLAYGTPAVEVAVEMRRLLGAWRMEDGLRRKRSLKRAGRQSEVVRR